MDAVLCDELLEEILCRLPPRSAFPPSTSDVSLVSKRWLRLYRSTRSTLSLRLSPDNSSSPTFSSFLSHFPHLSFLSLTLSDANTSPSSDHLFLSAASSFPRLRLLCLQPNPLSISTLLSLSSSCPHLTSLYIALSRPFTFHWLLSFHSLKNLGVHFTSVPVQSKYERRVDAASTWKSVDEAELKLETLVFSGIRRGDRGLDWLWRSCKRLRKLQLRCCEGIGDDASVSSFVDCFKGLQEVELRVCRHIADEVLSILAETCASLSSLLVHDSEGGEGLLQFVTRSSCDLQKLDLRLPFDVQNTHLLALAQNFRGLLSLRLCCCVYVTCEGLKSIMLAMTNELEELALVNCNLESWLLTTLGQKFRNLRKLDLSDNEMLVDEEFTSMLESCSFLTELKVNRCTGWTNASVISMFESCKQLEHVEIEDCPGIDAVAVELLFLNCLRLRQIHVEGSKLSKFSKSWASKKFIKVVAW